MEEKKLTDKNVLVIAYYFPPMGLSGVQRTLKFVKYLPEYGWKPVVLTCSPRNYYAYDDDLLNDLKLEETIIYRTPTKQTKQKTQKFYTSMVQKVGRFALQTIYQPDSKVIWRKPAIELGRKILKENKIDVIFATAPPWTDFMIAQQLSKEFDIPYVIDYRDVWTDNCFQYFPTPFHKVYAVNLEHDVLSHASGIIVTSRHTKELLIKRYDFLGHKDISIIPHGYDAEDFEGLDNIKPNPSKFTITHSGLFQDNRTPKYFFQAMQIFLRNNPEAADILEAKFIGLMRKNHLKFIKEFSLERNVKLLGYMSHKNAVEELVSSDVLWLMQKDDVRTPGKLYEYIGARKPLLVSLPDGVMKQTALATKACIATNPDDVPGIVAALEKYYSLWRRKSLPEMNYDFVKGYERYRLTAMLAREMAMSMRV